MPKIKKEEIMKVKENWAIIILFDLAFYPDFLNKKEAKIYAIKELKLKPSDYEIKKISSVTSRKTKK
ncbi:hypothetical protein KAJ61_00495 [Candidatus Parcubacteria bacterium]|nr:hypothetical protein [Candidatus Parcubacteria bacterium]